MKKFKSSKRFENFLKMSSQSSLVVSEDQIDVICPGLAYDDVLRAVEIAGWTVQKSELLQNGLIVFSLIDKKRMCSCGEPVKHYHFDEPCCGLQYCCPEFPVPADYELEAAQVILRIRGKWE
jgi:hypothetical protein